MKYECQLCKCEIDTDDECYKICYQADPNTDGKILIVCDGCFKKLQEDKTHEARM